MYNPGNGDCLIFNGEIYNFRRLRAELQCEGVLFRGHSDTEVLLHVLSRWGEAALKRIQGMYALAFYQASTRRILLARDPLGIKPLYFSASSNKFVFASEIRAVRASQLADESLDVSGIASMLAYGAVQSPRTIFNGIRSFPAGHFQWIDAEAVTGRVPSPPQRFWQYPAVSTSPVDVPTAATNVRLLMHDAVLRHLIADVPVGVFLSAGIDSTVIASLAREYTPRVTAFTVGFGAVHGEDEVRVASQTAEALGIAHVAVDLDISNMPQQWRDWIRQMDSPSIDGFNTYAVSRRLAEEGVIVGLSGLGADELFGGYPAYSLAPWLSRVLSAARLFPAGIRAAIVRGLGGLYAGSGAIDKLADLVGGEAGIPQVALSLRRALSNNRLAALGLPSSRTQLLANYLDPESDFDPTLSVDPFNSVARVESNHYMRDTLLRDTDANSMRRSLEVRVPFLDLPLVEYVSSLPGHIKQQRGARSKALLRLACRKVIRDDIAQRPKTGFTLPIGDWMRREMRDSCEAAIDRVAQVPFLDGQEVRRIWDSFVSDSRALHWSRPMALVVLGSCIE